MSNSKKVVVITGASQGLGAAAVKAYRELDYRVVATSRSIKNRRRIRTSSPWPATSPTRPPPSASSAKA
ncbi:NAD(P)-dependent dehydrogenase (short-subunit alcohol dehydrogenase family) [Pseudomonas sp. W2I6]|nr:NAD(P)-dependent dehydrogenase (short-subunit alcohol dehydrogenase family) [Pseudomonas sp. W2I6]